MTNPPAHPADRDDSFADALKAMDAIDKAPATTDGKPATMPCPACGTGTITYTKGTYRNRPMVRAACSTPDCIRLMT